jgi:hypothetical protein
MQKPGCSFTPQQTPDTLRGELQGVRHSLLVIFGTFGVSFLARPVGAIFLGAYGDRKGRKAALTLSILLMMIGTGLMTIMPSYGSEPGLCRAGRHRLRRSADRHNVVCRSAIPGLAHPVRLRPPDRPGRLLHSQPARRAHRCAICLSGSGTDCSLPSAR